MALIIQKYGGTSVADAECIRKVARRVVDTHEAGNQVVVCVSAMAGETSWVRPRRPWRPSKLRLDVEAQRSWGSSLSGFMARHMEQPGSRHSKPASRKILSRPSDSA